MSGDMNTGAFAQLADKISADPMALVGVIAAAALFVMSVVLVVWAVCERVSWGADCAPSIFLPLLYLVGAFTVLDGRLGTDLVGQGMALLGIPLSFISIAISFALLVILPWVMCARGLLYVTVFAKEEFGGFGDGSLAYRVFYAIYSVLFLVAVPVLVFVL